MPGQLCHCGLAACVLWKGNNVSVSPENTTRCSIVTGGINLNAKWAFKSGGQGGHVCLSTFPFQRHCFFFTLKHPLLLSCLRLPLRFAQARVCQRVAASPCCLYQRVGTCWRHIGVLNLLSVFGDTEENRKCMSILRESIVLHLCQSCIESHGKTHNIIEQQ